MSDRVSRVLEMCHQGAHAASNDPEDYLFVCMTKRDLFLSLLGAVLGAREYPCLEDDILVLEHKLGGAIDIQKPEWRVND